MPVLRPRAQRGGKDGASQPGRRTAKRLAELHAMAVAQGGVCLSDDYGGMRARYRFRCAQGHKWEAADCNVLNGTWCRRCAGAAGMKRSAWALRRCARRVVHNGGICRVSVGANLGG